MSGLGGNAGQGERRGPLAWMAENAVAANLVMLVLLCGGLLFLPSIRQEVFPEVDLGTITVTVPYPGATPAEVEQGVVLPVEEAVDGIDGVEEIRSVAREGVGQVTAELFLGADRDRALNDIKNAVDRITAFPEDAERPIYSVESNRREVISLILYGPLDRETLKQIAEEVRSELLQDKRITLLEIEGLPPPEIGIEVAESELRRYDLTLDEIASIVDASSVEIAGGSVKGRRGEVLLRTANRLDYGEEFRRMPVISRPDGSQVTLGEIGTVRDGFREEDREAYFNDGQAVRLRAFRLGEQTPIDVSKAVREYVQQKRRTLPEQVRLAVWNDFSEIYDQRIGLLRKNGLIGLILVLMVLGLFLRMRLAFWVALGIATAFVGSFLFIPAMGISINMISLFAFLLAIGIVVDDAIVVGEAAYTQRQKGLGSLEASIAGVREVAGPVTFSVLTTIIAFTPMLFVPGMTGKLFQNIPLVVIPILVLSLIEAFFVLPSHLAYHGDPRRSNRWAEKFYMGQQRFADWLQRFIEYRYAPFARQLLVHPYTTLAIAGSLLILALGVVLGGRIGFNFLPRIEGDLVTVNAELPFGVAPEETRRVMDRLRAEAEGIVEDWGGREVLSRGILAELGRGGTEFDPAGVDRPSGGHLASVAVSLVPPEEREVTASEFAREWRRRVGELPGVERLSFNYSLGVEAGPKVSIELSHEQTETLEAAASRLAEALRTYQGVFDVDKGFQRGKEQLDFQLKPTARSLGLTQRDLARQVRGAFFGAEADRQQRGRDELRIYVRRPIEERQSEYFVENMVIQTPEGGEMPLRQAASVVRGTSFTEIERKQGRRTIEVTADVESEVTTGGEVTRALEADVLPGLLEQYPGLSYERGGEQEEQAEALEALWRGMALAFFAMFALLAVAFRSYVQPLLVMAAIPFGIVGAIGGHLIMGYELSIVSLFGIVALAGVVVNGSLVLISVINEHRDGGMPVTDAIVAGALRRFRPIVLTSLTTFFGLLPIIFEPSVQARFLIPMAISLGFGVLFMTVITLVIVPAAYRVMADWVRLGRG